MFLVFGTYFGRKLLKFGVGIVYMGTKTVSSGTNCRKIPKIGGGCPLAG